MLRLLLNSCYDCQPCKLNRVSPVWGHPVCYLHAPCSKLGNEWNPTDCDFCESQRIKFKNRPLAEKHHSLKEIKAVLCNIQFWYLKGQNPKVWLYADKVRSFLSEFHTIDSDKVQTLERTNMEEINIKTVQDSITTYTMTTSQFTQLNTNDIANNITIITNKAMSYTISQAKQKTRAPKDVASKIKGSNNTQMTHEPIKDLLAVSTLKVCPLGHSWIIYNPKVHNLISENKLSFKSQNKKHVFHLDIIFKDENLHLFKVKVDHPWLPTHSPPVANQTKSIQTQTEVTTRSLITSGMGGGEIWMNQSWLNVEDLDITHLNALNAYISRIDKARKDSMSLPENNIFDTLVNQESVTSNLELICESYYALRECRTRTEELLVHKTITQKMYYLEICKGSDADQDVLRYQRSRLSQLVVDITNAIRQWQHQMFETRLPYFV